MRVLRQWLLGATCAFVLAPLTTPADVSGAVLLLPVQVSVLGVPSPAVTPTNLLYDLLGAHLAHISTGTGGKGG